MFKLVSVNTKYLNQLKKHRDIKTEIKNKLNYLVVMYINNYHIYINIKKTFKFHSVESTDRLIQNKIATIWTDTQWQVVIKN